jgi:hypothetical protein
MARLKLHGPGWYAIVSRRTTAQIRPSRVPFRECADVDAERIIPYLRRCHGAGQGATAPDPIIVGPYDTREAAWAADRNGPNPTSLFEGLPSWLSSIALNAEPN